MLLVREELRRAVPPGLHAVSVGVFDGVHGGHRALLARMLAEGHARGLGGGVVTFHPHPQTVVRPDRPFSYVESLERRVELLRECGVDFVAVLTFTSELQQVSAADFTAMLVEEVGMRTLVVGSDFRLGRAGEGDIPRLTAIGAEQGFEVVPVDLVSVDAGPRVSSTRIREALADGRMGEVEQLLGRPYALRGPVLHGDERGRTIGFPTLNIGVSADRALPPNGVYVTRAHLPSGVYRAVTNIGTRPTVSGDERRVETHVFDYAADTYGEVVTVELLHRLRDERRFESLDALRQQIEQDARAAQEWFA